MAQLTRLNNWYACQCDGDWEHSYGVSLETLDNPGWLLQIDLTDTELEGRPFQAIHEGDSDNDANWMQCKVELGKFQAAGAISSLPAMLETFLSWAGL